MKVCKPRGQVKRRLLADQCPAKRVREVGRSRHRASRFRLPVLELRARRMKVSSRSSELCRDLSRIGRRGMSELSQLGVHWRRSWDEAEQAGLSSRDRAARLGLLGGFGLLWAAVVCARLHYLQHMDAERWVGLASRQQETSIEVEGARGTVLDAAGRILAVSVEAASIGAHVRDISNRAEFAARVAVLLGKSKAAVEHELNTTKPFIWLARSVPASVGHDLESLDLAGLSVVKEFRRFYPQGDLASPIIGRVSRDGAGQAGIELAFERKLSAADVRIALRRDARGRLVAKASQVASHAGSPEFAQLFMANSFQSPAEESEEALNRTFRKEGGELELTIDTVVQGIVEQELERGTADAKAKRAWALAVDADSGEILAAGQAPRFNPNNLERLSPEDLRNFVAQDSFEPGSTFKPIVAAVALDHGRVGLNEMLDCEGGQYRVGKHTIKDVHPAGVISFPDVLVRSSNICMVKLGQRLGKNELHQGIKAFGFGESTGSEMHGETQGILKKLDVWREIDVATNSFGQGISVSGLQMVQAYAALANGGLLIKPTIVKTGTEQIVRRVLKPETAAHISAILQGVTESEHGTGKHAAISGVHVSGKTGTAQKAMSGCRGYDSTKVLASFIGFVDGRGLGVNRKIVMLVVVDEPGVYPRWGGTVAAPIYRRAMERILSHLMSSGDANPARTAMGGRQAVGVS